MRGHVPRRQYRPYPFGWQFRGAGNGPVGPPEGKDTSTDHIAPTSNTEVQQDNNDQQPPQNDERYSPPC